jgi:hypothetical protein
MPQPLLEVSRSLVQLAQYAVSVGKTVESIQLYEQAYTAALMQSSPVPAVFRFRGDLCPGPLASPEHIAVRMSQNSVIVDAPPEFLALPCSDFRRLPVIGAVCGGLAETLGENDALDRILDIGDGNDQGHYIRGAYSSALPGSRLIVDPYFLFYDDYSALRSYTAQNARAWKDRKDVVFWRGTTTGRRLYAPPATDVSDWKWLPRLQLCWTARQSPFVARLDIAVSEMAQIEDPTLQEAIRQTGMLRPAVPKSEFLEYRYLIDIDGYSNSWSLVEKLIIGATILKVDSTGGFRQIFYDRLVPWKTHIPIAADLSDFDEKLSWAFDNPSACEEIAANAAALGRDLRVNDLLLRSQQALMQ